MARRFVPSYVLAIVLASGCMQPALPSPAEEPSAEIPRYLEHTEEGYIYRDVVPCVSPRLCVFGPIRSADANARIRVEVPTQPRAFLVVVNWTPEDDLTKELSMLPYFHASDDSYTYFDSVSGPSPLTFETTFSESRRIVELAVRVSAIRSDPGGSVDLPQHFTVHFNVTLAE